MGRNSRDLVKITINFEAAESKIFRIYSGVFVRGFVYWVLLRENREFARKLHRSKSLAPFSVTPVMKNEIPVEKLEEGEDHSFSITFFVPEIGDAIKNYLMRTDSLYFTAVKNKIKEINVDNLSAKDFPEIPLKKFRVRFITPCYFRIPGKYYRFVPLPIPELIFRSLSRLYSAFVSTIPTEFREWVNSGAIVVSGHKIETKVVDLKKGNWSSGFVGWVNFSIPKENYVEDFSKIVYKLLKFGEYSNVGGGRTSGLGVIKIENIE
ncbi:MAG: CRISPR-associated endoribonuclease Cas6 [Archaeoglobaceae archaeon]|nr:CRISPR-associated endoribonuclease Cas6 [Archaeoglobaceae archaeon]MCX8152685.1 CRISPR-associated endoribonuclease Cas6 [Archaeoglobaceae archaeon]